MHIDNFKKYIREIILALTVMKGIFGHLLLPLIGILGFLKNRTIDTRIKYLLGMFLIGMFLGLYFKSLESILRVCQLLGIILAANYLITARLKFLIFGKIILVTSVLVLVYDLIFVAPLIHTHLGLNVYRYKGLLREYNFSAALYFCIFVIFERNNKKTLMLLTVVLILSTFSRGAMVPLILYYPLKLICTKFEKIKLPLGVIIFTFPLWVQLVNHVDKNLYDYIDKVSSYRISIQRTVLNEVEKTPQGVGYFRGRAILEEYVKSKTVKFDAWEPHNVFVQVLFEFGYIGYLLIAMFTFLCLLRAKKPYICLSGMILFSNLNGLHELSFYLLMLFSSNEF